MLLLEEMQELKLVPNTVRWPAVNIIRFVSVAHSRGERCRSPQCASVVRLPVSLRGATTARLAWHRERETAPKRAWRLGSVCDSPPHGCLRTR
jgi:hypothetical protein